MKPGFPQNQDRLDWWSDGIDESQRHQIAWTALEALRTLQSMRISAGMLYESIYEQRNPYSSDGTGIGSQVGELGYAAQRDEISLLTYNAMQIGFDTLVSKLMQADPQVVCQTDNASFETRQKAEVLERIIRAEFDACEFYEHAEEQKLDMLLYGFGAVRWYVDREKRRPACIRRHPLDLWWDAIEGRDQPPLTMYDTILVSKAQLQAEYPDQAERIAYATIGQNRQMYTLHGVNMDTMCEVVEAWRRPIAGLPGRYMKFVSSCVLGEPEEFKDDEFPFSFSFWTKRRRGPYPIPAAEQVVFLQRNLNRLIERQHECIYTLATPRIILDEHSGVPASQFQTSGVSDIIMGDFTGRPEPTIMNAHVVPDDIVFAINQTKQDIANILGINSLESVGDSPTSLESAPALQEYTNQSGIRHFKTLKENERSVLRAAKMLLLMLRKCVNEWGKYPVLTEAMGEYETVDFAEHDLPPNQLKIKLAPANALPLMPAGRLDKVMQIAQTGIFTPKQAIRAMQSPDIMAITSDLTASEKEIEWAIYKMSKPDATYLGPTEHDDLNLGLEKFNAAWLRGRRQGMPDRVLAKYEQWIAEALLLQKQQQAELQAQLMAQQAQQQMMAQPNSQQTAPLGEQQPQVEPPQGAQPSGNE